MTSIRNLEHIAEAEAYNGGFSGSVKLTEVPCKPCFQAGIDTKTMSQIGIKYNPEYEQRKPGRSETVITDIVRHEVNHKGYAGLNGCPRNVDMHAKLIIEPMSQVLKKRGYGPNDVHYVANAFEDTVLHADLSSKFSLEGIASFLDDVGHYSAAQKFTPFYQAHAMLNLHLWGSKKQKAMMQKYYLSPDKKDKQAVAKAGEVYTAVKNFLKRAGISDIRSGEYRDRAAVRAFLNDENNWPKIAKIYAEEFSRLMQPNYAMPLQDHSGDGTKGQEDGPTYGSPADGNGSDEERDGKNGKGGKASKGDSGEDEDGGEINDDGGNEGGQQDGGTEDKPSQNEGNEFDREMHGNEYMRKRVQEAYNSNVKPPQWMGSYEAMDMIYQILAQRLNIRAETFTQQTSMPIYRYGKRPFDPMKDSPKHTTFGFDDKGKIQLMKRRYHEDMPLEYKVSPKGFPEMRFCLLDTSGSMGLSPSNGDNVGKKSVIPWGDNSKYHYALLGWYGLIEYLKQNHLLKQTSVGIANFGTTTEVRQGLDEAKKLALKPQFGSTHLNLGTVQRMFRNDGMLIFTISDGDIDNWGSIKNDFIKMAKRHYYFHLQIGCKNSTTSDMERAGLKVAEVTGTKDLATTVIDLTDRLYRVKK